MDQRYMVFNVDKRQGWECGRFLEGWSNGTVAELMRALTPATAIVPTDPLASLQARKETLWKNQHSPRKTGLPTLPIEIHVMVLNFLEDFYDVYALCVTNTYFWVIGMSRLRALFIREAARMQELWAGDRMILVGDSANNYPEEVFADDELDELDSLSISEEDPYERLSYWAIPRPKTYWYLEILLEQNERFHDEMARWRAGGGQLAAIEWYRNVHAWYDPYSPHPMWETRNGIPWVLRNLNKKVFVRLDEFALCLTDISGIKLKKLTIGHLVYSKIIWSDLGSFGDVEVLRKGDWAGDRLDIVQIDKFNPDGWKNVSEEAQKDLLETWEYIRRRHWEENISQ